MTMLAVGAEALKRLGDEEEALPGHRTMEVLDHTGDSKFQWDPNVPAEVEAARVQFNSLRAKQYDAFRVTGRDGSKGEIMKEFDPGAAQMIMSPRMVGG